jgi:hypothetical protein
MSRERKRDSVCVRDRGGGERESGGEINRERERREERYKLKLGSERER